MNTLTCPKCHGTMRQYERNGVTVDQCSDCRGIFLDRGELERLVEADNRWAEQTYTPPPQARQPDSRTTSGSYDPRYSGHRKKKKHWLEELFD